MRADRSNASPLMSIGSRGPPWSSGRQPGSLPRGNVIIRSGIHLHIYSNETLARSNTRVKRPGGSQSL